MTKNKKVRIELRYDEINDKEMIKFIDENGSTRAGFIKHVLQMYKNQVENITPESMKNSKFETPKEKKKPKKSKPKIKDISFSSKNTD